MSMMSYIRSFLVIILLLPAFLKGSVLSAANDVFISPSAQFSAFDVVEIQLLGLKASAQDRMAGIEQVWIFAHPDNKRMTGPLERFAGLFDNPAYAPLIGHSSASIKEVDRQDGMARFVVTVLARDGKTYGYYWILRALRGMGHKQSDGDIWMTSAVSAPRIGSAS